MRRYAGQGLDAKILAGQAFRQDVYHNGQIVRSDKDHGRFNFNPVRRRVSGFSSEGAYHVAEGSNYRPPYRNGYVSVYYRGVDIPSAFQGLGIQQHPAYGYSLKFDMTNGDTLLKVARSRTSTPAFLSHSGLYTCILEGVFYDQNGIVNSSKDYYLNFSSFQAMESFCTTWNLDVPIPEEKFDMTWINGIICDSSSNPLQIKSYVEIEE